MKIHVTLIPISSTDQPPPSPDPPEHVYHYTTVEKLRSIINSGEIRPSNARIEPHEKPVVWFSSRPTWEPTATKCPLTGKLGQIVTAAAQGGLARIAVSIGAAPYGFPQLPLMAGTSPQECIGLLLAGLEVGADPNHWRFSLQPVPRELWTAVELYDFETDRWSDAGILQANQGSPDSRISGLPKPSLN